MAKKRKRYQKRGWKHSRVVLATGVLMGAVVLVVGMAVWTGQAPQEGKVTVTASGDRLHRVPAEHLPAFAVSESPLVQNNYRFAVAHPDTLGYIPCFCGCDRFGHRHNGDCYVQARHSDGTVTFTSHGAT
ncbi:MAG: PCYCGC motif-containing (lipo)protein [Candidatus Methylomirabilales bacterium]